MRKSTTKRALLMSSLAILLSVSMLVGTTFAWFTDTVSSGTNTIVAGNLDIELYHSNKEVTDEKVEPTTKLFTDVALWEPGAMVYEKFTVANLGDLALKYQFNLNASGATVVDGTSFASMLKVAVVGENYTYDRAAILADTTLNWKPLETFTLSDELEGYDKDTDTEYPSDVFGIIIYWQPSDNDNLFNMNNANKGKQVSIDLGVTLFATQDDVEADGFDSTYDENAWADGMQVFNANDLQSAINNAELGDTIVIMDNIVTEETIVIPAAPATYSLRNATPAVVIDLNGKTITGNMHKSEGAVIKNEGNLVLKNGIVSSTGNNGGSAIQNSGTVVIENVTLNGAPNADGSWPSYTVNNTGSLEATNVKITSYHGAVASYNEGAVVTLNNSEIDMEGIPGFTSHGIYTYNSGSVVVNGGVYANKAADQNSTGASVVNGNVTVNGGTFTGRIENYYGNPVINAGNFSVAPNSKFLAEGKTTISNADGSYTVLKGDVAASDNAGLNDAIANGESNIALGKGEFTMPAVGDVTISGTTDTVIQLTTSVGKNVTLNGVTVVAGAYQGIQHSETVVYENCVIKGIQFLYANKVIFKNCTIDLSETADYIWTYSAKNVEFIDCVFNTMGKAILLYNEGPDLVTNVTVKGCTFNATASEDKAAIEIDSHYAVNGHYTLTTENNVFDSEHFTGEWRIKNGATNNTTVNGVTYTWVADGLYKGADNTYYVYDANGLKAINDTMASKSAGREVVINLLNDIDFAGKTWTPVDSHIDWNNTLKEFNGNGYTISNLTVNGQAMFTRFSNNHNVVFKNVTFDNATVNSNGNLNTAIIVGHTYDNVLLDNVDVVNSTVTGGYKVAPLIATVYNESARAITATLNNCDVSNTVVTATSYDFCTTGMVAFVYAGYNSAVEFENCTVTNVSIFAPNVYTAHAWVYTTGSETLFNDVEGVTVSGCTFENK